MAAVKTPRVRISKNKKKNWRKHCDVKDVEDYLEEKRFEERIGGAVSEKPDKEIFFLDTKIQAVNIKSTRVFKPENLRCHTILTAYSNVQPPVISKSGITKKQKAKIEKVEKRKFRQILNGKNAGKTKSQPLKTYDLWAEDAKEKNIDPEIKELIDYGDEIMKKKPVKVPAHIYQKPSLLPAVEVPHPGASYNPSYEDHQALLSQAVLIEEKKLKQEMHLKRILTDMFPTKENAPTEETWIQEMSQGLNDEANEDNVLDVQDGSNTLTINPVVTTEGQKSQAQRKKEKARKEMERQRLLEKETKKEVHQIYRLRSILSEIKAKERAADATRQKTEQKLIDRKYQPHRLGPYKYEANDLEVNLSEELQGSLRGLKTEGNILEDRYKSLQRRNIIEPRIKQLRKRKYKLKKQIKRGHRDM